MFRFFPISAFAVLVLGCCSLAVAQPQEPADPDLPQPVDTSFAEALVTQSPFTRSVNLEDSLQLTGIAYVDGKPVATFLNRETNKRLTITEEPNAEGWKLTHARSGIDLQDTEVEIMVGPELVTVHYGDQQMNPGSGKDAKGKNLMAASNTSSSKGDKVKTSALLDAGDRKAYASLSPEARDRFKDIIRSHLEKNHSATPEQNAAFAQKVFAKIKASDHAAAAPKVGKAGKKNKQPG